jgi:hypothetical protein
MRLLALRVRQVGPHSSGIALAPNKQPKYFAAGVQKNAMVNTAIKDMLEVNNQRAVEKDRVHPSADLVCILVASSDRARDIFQIVFQNAAMIWRDCDWPRYVGFTTKHPDIHGFKALAATRPSDWRGELADQLDSLPNNIRYVTLIIEDFLFTSPVNGAELKTIADLMVIEDLSYVRLISVSRNIPGSIIEYFRRKLSSRPLRPLLFSEPYYSSVNVAIWKRDYLRKLLRQPGTIWEFEHTVSTERHYAVWKRVVNYQALVGRGKWYVEAPHLLAQQGLELSNSKRERHMLRTSFQRIRQKIAFQVFGYLSFRIRRGMNRLARS